MRSRRPESHAGMWFVGRRLRLRFVAFLVRMWLRLAWPALYLPEAVFRKRLAAPRCVLILGIAVSLSVLRYWPGRWPAPRFPSCPCRFDGRGPRGAVAGPTGPYAQGMRTEPRIMHGMGFCLQIRGLGRPGRPMRAGRRAGSLLLRRDHHDHLATFQARPGLDHDVLAQVGLDARGH